MKVSMALAVVEVRGAEAAPFLQGLLTADVNDVTPDKPCWAGILTPEGRFLFDFMLMAQEEGFFLLAEAQHAKELVALLTRYRLRRDVKMVWREDLEVRWEDVASSGALPDPRHPGLGHWVVAQGHGPRPLPEAYHLRRYQLGISQGRDELGYEKGIVLEHGWDEMGAISWTKGCYVGQELMARTKHAGMVRKSVRPLWWEGKAPLVGETLAWDGHPCGRVIAGGEGKGLALVRGQDFLGHEHLVGTSSGTLVGFGKPCFSGS